MSRRKTSKPKQIEASVKNGDLNNRILHRKFQLEPNHVCLVLLDYGCRPHRSEKYVRLIGRNDSTKVEDGMDWGGSDSMASFLASALHR